MESVSNYPWNQSEMGFLETKLRREKACHAPRKKPLLIFSTKRLKGETSGNGTRSSRPSACYASATTSPKLTYSAAASTR
jgi:hypothetical protein